MSFIADFAPWFGGSLLGIASFLIGKSFTQSEKVLDQKRRAYEVFLEVCPSPNEAHSPEFSLSIEFQRSLGVMSIYGSSDSVKFASEYFLQFSLAQDELANVEAAGHPVFLQLMTHYNRMIWEMRKDVMTWSVFAPARSARDYRPSIHTGT